MIVPLVDCYPLLNEICEEIVLTAVNISLEGQKNFNSQLSDMALRQITHGGS